VPERFPGGIPETFLSQEEHEKQENDLREMKKKVDSKEAEAANLRKENGKLKQDLQENKNEIKLIKVRNIEMGDGRRDNEEERRERREEKRDK